MSKMSRELDCELEMAAQIYLSHLTVARLRGELNYDNSSPTITSFKAGAKFQAERDRADVEILLEALNEISVGQAHENTNTYRYIKTASDALKAYQASRGTGESK